MRFLLFLGAVSILALGFAATRVLGREAGLGFLVGALTLGGGLAISGLFALRWKWHGLLGAGLLALLGFARYLTGNRETGALPVFESASTLICLLLLVAVARTFLAERQRRQLETLRQNDT
jgi:hypothetical protein